MADEKIILNEGELDEVSGGRHHQQKKRTKTKCKCQKCAVDFGINEDIWEYDGKYICMENAHLYGQPSADAYLYQDFNLRNEAKNAKIG